jgi:hypothetical protein
LALLPHASNPPLSNNPNDIVPPAATWTTRFEQLYKLPETGEVPVAGLDTITLFVATSTAAITVSTGNSGPEIRCPTANPTTDFVVIS